MESSKPAKLAFRVMCVRSSPYAAMLAAQDVAARCKEQCSWVFFVLKHIEIRWGIFC